MDAIAARCFHIETAVTVVFLGMLARAQAERPSEAPLTSDVRIRARFFAAAFLTLAAGFTAMFGRLSPLFAVELAAGLTLALMHPANALCLLVHMLFLRPWEIVPWEPALAALPRLLLGTCVVSSLLTPRRGLGLGPGPARALALLGAFCGWLLLTTLVAPEPEAAQTEWLVFLRSPVLLVLCVLLLRDERSVGQLEGTLWLSALTVVLLGFYQYLAGGPVEDPGPAAARLQSFGGLSNSNDTAAVAVMGLPFAAARLSRPGAVARLAKLAVSALLLLAVWYSRSRGAMLAVLAAAFAPRLLEVARRGRASALALACVLGLGYAGASRLLAREAEDLQMSTASRVVYWKAAGRMLLSHPVAGVGFSRYPANYEAYSPYAKHEWGLRTAHSSWLLVFAEAGLVGGGLFAAFAGLVAREAWRARAARPEQFRSLIAYGVAMSFLSHAYLIYPYLLFGLILASASVRARRAEPKAGPRWEPRAVCA